MPDLCSRQGGITISDYKLIEIDGHGFEKHVMWKDYLALCWIEDRRYGVALC